ncbi:MAG: Hsp20/alpha crystallin family protein [Eubacteriaceae bacterium]|nr:Hsp20/alpha crystallin family protein [Eubacteriaceae bacterium]
MDYNYSYPSRLYRGRPERNFLMFFDDYVNNPEKYMDSKYFTFNVDVRELKDEYIIEAEMPGHRKEDLSVEAEGGQIILSAKRMSQDDKNSGQYIKSERNFGHFQRIFYLQDLDENSVTAEYKDGLLTVHAKKTTELSGKKNKIQIQ